MKKGIALVNLRVKAYGTLKGSLILHITFSKKKDVANLLCHLGEWVTPYELAFIAWIED